MGNTEKAIENYRAFIELWKNADPELQPRVADAKRRLARLGAAGATASLTDLGSNFPQLPIELTHGRFVVRVSRRQLRERVRARTRRG